VVSSILEHTTPNGVLRQNTQKTREKCYSIDALLAVVHQVGSDIAKKFCFWTSLNDRMA